MNYSEADLWRKTLWASRWSLCFLNANDKLKSCLYLPVSVPAWRYFVLFFALYLSAANHKLHFCRQSWSNLGYCVTHFGFVPYGVLSSPKFNVAFYILLFAYLTFVVWHLSLHIRHSTFLMQHLSFCLVDPPFSMQYSSSHSSSVGCTFWHSILSIWL